jgi:hypothetical protein
MFSVVRLCGRTEYNRDKQPMCINSIQYLRKTTNLHTNMDVTRKAVTYSSDFIIQDQWFLSGLLFDPLPIYMLIQHFYMPLSNHDHFSEKKKKYVCRIRTMKVQHELHTNKMCVSFISNKNN